MYNDQYLIPEWRTAPKLAGRNGVEMGLFQLENDQRVIVLTADLAETTRVSSFGKKYPNRFLDVSVAEQNLIGVATGMALEGLIPFTSSYAVFSPGRSWEQVRVSVCLTNANVKIIGGHTGVSVGENGPSHQALEDIAIMRVLPNMTVLTPADANQTAEAMVAAAKINGPVYIRTTRPEYANYTKPINFEVGKMYKYREGKDVTIVACGIQVWDALMIAEKLVQDGIDCEVLNASSIKPFDAKALVESARKTGRVVTIEDHQIIGGLGSVVAETLSQELPVQVTRIGINDSFGISASWEEVYKQFGLDQKSLYNQLKLVIA
ncbi:MAG: transketolase C-terminal domain-containing protein [bacterium]